MTAAVPLRPLAHAGPWLLRMGPLAVLVAVTVVLGGAGLGVVRLLFVAGCLAVAWHMLKYGAGAHLSACLALFCFAPLLRRVVDVSAGYDPSGIMLSGPLLALLAPLPQVAAALAARRRFDPALRPFLLAAACVVYATLLTVFQGDLAQAATGALKWGAPVLYGIWLHGEARRDPRIIESATLTFMVVMPLAGLYGFMQYLDPLVWDRYWMVNTTIASIGQPEPGMVRVFSTMNAPAGYATFTAAALMLFGFRRARWGLLLAAAPSVLGLLLSLYRTAWIALAAGLMIGLLHRRTRGRAATLMVAVMALAVAAILLTPAGEMLQERLLTLGNANEDASGQERLGEYAALMEADGGTLLGHGFSSTDVMQAGALAHDGQLVVCWHTMGLVVGILSVAAVCWAAWQAMRRAWRSPDVSGVAISGIMAGALVQVPLAVISSAEIGFLFWSLAAIGAARRSFIQPPPSLAQGYHGLTSPFPARPTRGKLSQCPAPPVPPASVPLWRLPSPPRTCVWKTTAPSTPGMRGRSRVGRRTTPCCWSHPGSRTSPASPGTAW